MATTETMPTERGDSSPTAEVDKMFRACVKLEGSDLHLKVGKPPIVRIKGTLRPLNREPISDDEMQRLLWPLMGERARSDFHENGGADFAHTVDVEGENWRFRVNVLQQMGHMGLVARRVLGRRHRFRHSQRRRIQAVAGKPRRRH